jgi:divalent metal cation (Fe/Co/Zn/Cd) transporter
VSSGLSQLPLLPTAPLEESAIARTRWRRRARLLAWSGLAWHFVEFAIAVGAGIAASSIALVGFGVDSLIESLAGLVVIWLFTGRRLTSETAERRAQLLIAVSFFILAGYIAIEALRTLFGGQHPEVSWVGIGLAAVTAPTMPLLASAKRRVGRELGSAATVSEASQNMVCAYLSVALLIGLGANAFFGWWWADPAAALVISAVALREGLESWRGESCGCCAPATQARGSESHASALASKRPNDVDKHRCADDCCR